MHPSSNPCDAHLTFLESFETQVEAQNSTRAGVLDHASSLLSSFCFGSLLVALWLGQSFEVKAQNLPTGWTNQDIGSPGLAGSASISTTTGTWTVTGGGSDIWGGSDKFHYVSRTLNGDGSIIARVGSVMNTSPWAKAGVMIRNNVNPGSEFADVVLTRSNSVSFQWRASAGAAASATYVEGIVAAPIWVQLARKGDAFFASYSYDGLKWVQISTGQNVTMGTSALAGLAVTAVNNAALNTATFSSASVVDAGWNDLDIGSPDLAGSSAFDGSTWTVSGGGSNIGGASDQFNFANQTCVGDVTIIAKLNTLGNSASDAKAGLMIRDGTAANASYASMFLTAGTGAANFEYRDGAGSSAVSAAKTAGITAPQWLKLVRSGTTFGAYYSADGVNWIQNGGSRTLTMGQTVNVGLAVSAGNNASRNTATFSNVSIIPTGWDDADIGAPGVSGGATFDGLAWTVRGGGSDIWGTSDQCHYASQSFAGDVTIVACVNSLLPTGNYAKSGVMIRDNMEANASYAYAFLSPQGVSFEYRDVAGTSSRGAGSVAGVAAPSWLKLVRSGSTFTAFYSSEGKTWTQLGASTTIAMSSTARVGMAVNANNATALGCARFSNVQVGAQVINPFLKQNGQDFRNGHGTGNRISLRGSNLGGWLLHESWINTMDGSELPDDVTVRNTLQTRFGTATANRLIYAFTDNWITELDLDNIRALGLNVIRVPFSYRVVVDSNSNWRSDAFTKLDWVVDEAWKRGIYVILDLHGAPGGVSPWMSSGTLNGGAFWSNPSYQDLTATLWSRIAQHYAGHPGVAAYDLLNEPVPPSQEAMWNIYKRLYTVIREVDPDHIVMMEAGGGAGLGNTYWNLDSLPDPQAVGWVNVAYHTHAYALEGGQAGQSTANWHVQQFRDRSYYNVPVLIGEFNLGDANDYGVQLWNHNNLNWTSWTYKITDWVGNNWGIYGVSGQWPWRPNLQNDSATTILNAYTSSAGTAGRWSINPVLRDTLAPGLPSGWSDTDVASPGVAGWAAFNSATGAWLVAGSGSDIWNTSDQFHFTSQDFSGDGTLAARVNSTQNTGTYPKAGIMFRDSTRANASYAYVFLGASTVNFECRSGAGASSYSVATISGGPRWVKLTRTGNTFSAFASVDETVWTQLGTPRTVAMPNAAKAGLAVSANNNSALNISSFSSVSLLEPNWTNADIGSIAAPGNALFVPAAASWTLTGSGADIWNTADAFHFNYLPLAGTGTLVARVTELENTDPWAKAGVMIRESLAPGSPHALMALTAENGALFEWRTVAGNNSASSGLAGLRVPYWVKLTRSGNVFTGFVSSNGYSWTPVGSATISMNANTYVGLAVTSHHDGWLTTASFDYVSQASASSPVLTASRSTDLVILSWPATTTGLGLYSASDLKSETVWLPVTNTIVNQGGTLRVTLPLSKQNNQFFRLRPAL